MHGTTIDRRVKKTKKQLRLALMHLMTQKSAKSISVRELAEQADINRSTFYIHYKDVNDLLLHLEDEMAERLSELCRRHDPKDSMTGGYPFLTDLYAFIQENADLCKVLLGATVTGPIQSASAASYGMTSSRRICPCYVPVTGRRSTTSAPSSCREI